MYKNKTIEEKARAYDEALERARKRKNTCDSTDVIDWCEYLFPELKEGDDENIRRWIINDIRYNINNEPLNNSEYKKKAEKAIDWLEKQGEQKSADKIEPKFHVGEWVASKGLNTVRIINVEGNNNKYEVEFFDGDKAFLHIDYIDRFFHPWTIEDAKDGDVLAWCDCLVLFKKLDVLNIECYCTFYYLNIPCFHIDTLHYKGKFQPATKEQRDLLFSKIKKADYKWDFNKKELIKIEDEPKNYKQQVMSEMNGLNKEYIRQKSADKIEPKFNVGDWIVNEFGDWVVHIDSIDKKSYQVSDGKGNYNYFPISKQDEMHLWTIEDAKDGDVLSFYGEYKSNKMVQVGIIEKYAGKQGGCSNTFKIYVGINWDDNLQIGEYMGCSDIHPATKELRDHLFTKMKEAGYEWDFNKKELIKIGPKFKAGDWIVFNGITCYIKKVVNGLYITISKGGISNSYDWDIDNMARLWAIEDAKDGDVLVYKTDEEEWVLIYKEIVTSSSEVPHDLLRYYFLLTDNNCNCKGVCAMTTEDYEKYLKPATKEQRDILFTKMTEDGYKWDANKNELKMPAFSYEDERKIKNIVYFLETAKKHYASTVELDTCIDWLKTLKQRIGG